MNIDDNLTVDSAGVVQCRHCSATIGNARTDPLSGALQRVRPAADAGPGVHADPSHYTKREIVLRQAFCPGCYALLRTEIVPADEPVFRNWRLAAIEE